VSAPSEFEGQYVTEAVESSVYNGDGELIGHVTMLDLDRSTRDDARQVAQQLDGASAVVRSSDTSYHVWELTIRPLPDVIEQAELISRVDPEHVELSERRECSVVRIDEKVDAGTGEMIKPQPRVVETYRATCDAPQSAPHRGVLTELCSREPWASTSGWVGSHTERRVYMADIGGRSE